MGANTAVQDQTSSRERILDVAETLFARRGFPGVGMREVAEEVGLGKSSLFHHFGNKVDLYLEVLNRSLGRIDARVGPAVDSAGSASERLERVIDALIDSLVADPSTARLLLRALFEDESLPQSARLLPRYQAGELIIAALVDKIRQLIRDGVDAGEFRPVSAAHTIQTIVGATAYHFASGEFGEELIGGPLLASDAIERRRKEVKELLNHGLKERKQ